MTKLQLSFDNMKLTSLVRRFLVGVAGLSFMLGVSARADNNAEVQLKTRVATHQQVTKHRTVLTQITGSNIPQRVVLKGQQVNSPSPLYVVEGNELLRTSATSVAGMLSLDPSVTVKLTRR
jgi:hypothetical protein